MKRAVSLVIVDGHFSLPQGFLNVYGLTYSLYHTDSTYGRHAATLGTSNLSDPV